MRSRWAQFSPFVPAPMSTLAPLTSRGSPETSSSGSWALSHGQCPCQPSGGTPGWAPNQPREVQGPETRTSHLYSRVTYARRVCSLAFISSPTKWARGKAREGLPRHILRPLCPFKELTNVSQALVDEQRSCIQSRSMLIFLEDNGNVDLI